MDLDIITPRRDLVMPAKSQALTAEGSALQTSPVTYARTLAIRTRKEGKSLTNFRRTLPPEGSDMAEQILRDPYNFDFFTLSDGFKERELERGLLIHLCDLLLELGRGFAFAGSQVPLAVDDDIFYVDLLFYHLPLHSYFVIELKTGKFKPECAGKLNFYLLPASVSRHLASEDRPGQFRRVRDQAIVHHQPVRRSLELFMSYALKHQ
jgi:predicted nuclease of restriction endonuclease-like (RecB) superfamily